MTWNDVVGAAQDGDPVVVLNRDEKVIARGVFEQRDDALWFVPDEEEDDDEPFEVKEVGGQWAYEREGYPSL